MEGLQAKPVDDLVSRSIPPALEQLKVSDAVWVAAALLHLEQPDHDHTGFAIEEIVARVVREGITAAQRQTIYQHVNQHCVANRKPDPNRSRALFAVGRNRRLWRAGDAYDPAREGAAHMPANLPSHYAHLLGWYENWNRRNAIETVDPLLDLVGSGAHLWASEHADEYVNRLREGWA